MDFRCARGTAYRLTASALYRDQQRFYPKWLDSCYEQIPVVNTDFVTKFVGSSQFTGLDSLFAACESFNEYLEKKHPVKLDRTEVEFGDYRFEFPTVEQASDVIGGRK